MKKGGEKRREDRAEKGTKRESETERKEKEGVREKSTNEGEK